MKTILVLA